MLSKIFLSHLVFILIFVGVDLSAIAQDSVNQDPETNLETESPESNSPPISTSAATLGGPSSVDSELAEDAREKDSVFEGIDRALKPWFEFKERVNQDIGLKFGLDYSILYQGLTDSLGKIKQRAEYFGSSAIGLCWGVILLLLVHWYLRGKIVIALEPMSPLKNWDSKLVTLV